MAGDRSSSWLNEIGKAPPRKPSISGPLLPFSIPRDAPSKSFRSQSYSVGQMDPRAAFRVASASERFLAEDAVSESPLDQPPYTLRSRAQTNNVIFKPSMSPSMSSGMFGSLHSNGQTTDDYPSTPNEFRRRSTTTSRSYTVNDARDHDNFNASTLMNVPRSSSLYAHDSSRMRHEFEVRARRAIPEGSYCVVQFKNYRAEVYEFPPGFGLELQVDQLVLVEADRGSDLGVVVAVNQALPEAIQRKLAANQQHSRELLQYSSRAMQHAQSNPAAFNLGENTGHNNPAAGPIYSIGSHFPKAIRRLALDHEIIKFQEKNHAEEVAREMCQQKADRHGLRMDVLDAEYQIDSNKLTFYYYANHVIIFSELVAELFKAFKTRIWMAPVNSDAVPTSPITIRLPQQVPLSPRTARGSSPLSTYLGPLSDSGSWASRPLEGNGYSWSTQPRSNRHPSEEVMSRQIRTSHGAASGDNGTDFAFAANRPSSSRSSNLSNSFSNMSLAVSTNPSVWNGDPLLSFPTKKEVMYPAHMDCLGVSRASEHNLRISRASEHVSVVGERSESSSSRGLGSMASWEIP